MIRRSALCQLVLIFRLAWAQDAPPAPRGISLTEAMQVTLSRNPVLHIQERQVDLNRGLKQQESGRFDRNFDWTADHNRINTPLTVFQQQQAAQSGVITGNQGANLSDFNGSATQLLRSGITLAPNFQISRTTDNLLNFLGLNTSRAGFQVVLPVLRNRGRDVVAARETSAGFNVDASQLDLSGTVAELINNTVQSYWGVVASQKALEVAKSSEDRGGALAQNVRTLIDADRLARSEMNDVVANLADRTTARITAEQRVTEAVQALAIAMGVGYDQVADLITPTDPFPEPVDEAPSIGPKAMEAYIQKALTRRSDYLAQQKRRQAASTLVVAAKNQLRPQLDLSLSTGWSGLIEGTRPDKFFYSPFSNVQGLDAVASLHYNFSPRNNFAKGQLMQAEASSDQAKLQGDDLARRIASSVVVAVTSLRNSIARLKKARETVVAFQTALDGERDKLRLGIGSLVDILTIEDRLTLALESEVSAQLAYALSLVQLRFATGTLIEPNQTVQTVNRDIFYHFPSELGIP
jgi:outer membrane protein